MNHTVDGKNPAPVDMANKNVPLFTRFYTSQVLQDVFHQQYEPTYRIHKKICHKNIMQVTKSLIFTFWTTHCCEATSCLAAPSGYQPLPGWWRVATAVDSQQPWPSLELIFSAAGWNAMSCHVTRKHPGNPGGWSHTLMWRWCWTLLTSEFWCFVYQFLFISQSMRVWQLESISSKLIPRQPLVLNSGTGTSRDNNETTGKKKRKRQKASNKPQNN